MSFEDDIKKLEETHNAEHELFRAKEWFWRVKACINDYEVFWGVAWFDGGFNASVGETNTAALLNAYRKAQEMEGEE